MFGRNEKELTLACTYGSSVLKNNKPIPSSGLHFLANFFVSEIASEVLSWTNEEKFTEVQRPDKIYFLTNGRKNTGEDEE
jgi:hypothetical protein